MKTSKLKPPKSIETLNGCVGSLWICVDTTTVLLVLLVLPIFKFYRFLDNWKVWLILLIYFYFQMLNLLFCLSVLLFFCFSSGGESHRWHIVRGSGACDGKKYEIPIHRHSHTIGHFCACTSFGINFFFVDGESKLSVEIVCNFCLWFFSTIPKINGGHELQPTPSEGGNRKKKQERQSRWDKGRDCLLLTCVFNPHPTFNILILFHLVSSCFYFARCYRATFFVTFKTFSAWTNIATRFTFCWFGVWRVWQFRKSIQWKSFFSVVPGNFDLWNCWNIRKNRWQFFIVCGTICQWYDSVWSIGKSVFACSSCKCMHVDCFS